MAKVTRAKKSFLSELDIEKVMVIAILKIVNNEENGKCTNALLNVLSMVSENSSRNQKNEILDAMKKVFELQEEEKSVRRVH